jgi:ribosomal protein S18 acetylase RimI-like enzyme
MQSDVVDNPGMATGIRLARAADARVLAALRYEFRGGHAPPTESATLFVRRCTVWMRRALAKRGRWRCWVAVGPAGAIVGHVWVEIIEKVPNPGAEAERHAYVTNLFVQPAFRGGIGQRLLSAALGWCQAQGIGSVILWPTDDSRSLYARNGFVVSGDLLDLHLTGPKLATGRRGRRRQRRTTER